MTIADPQWIEYMYRKWRENPAALPADWHAFFSGFELGADSAASGISAEHALKQSGVQSLIYRYRDIGHFLACTDPLKPCPISHPLLDLTAFGLSETDLDTTFHTRRFLKAPATLREILDVMRETYCRSVGVEYMHIQNPAERQWLQDRIEPVLNRTQFPPEEKLHILKKLQEAFFFEDFLHRKFPGQKRFSLDGGDALIPFLDAVVNRAADAGFSDLILGMAHRGRLNVLANIFRKPYENIFSEFRDSRLLQVVGDGDVKYHKGFSIDAATPSGKSIHLSLSFNPSHLEAVNPVVEGKARARQDRYGDHGDQLVLPVLIHGDAAFPGQGVVAETLNFSQVDGYRTGGTFHIILNNQIGFTTLPASSRTSCYTTDLAKMISSPVFHVHGEDPEAVVHVAKLALDYRRQFRKDVFVEIICYRKYGHNEGDEPAFTQPRMYEAIRKRQAPFETYALRLAEEGIDPAKMQAQGEDVLRELNEALDRPPVDLDDGFHGQWSHINREWRPVEVETAVPGDSLVDLAGRLAQLPEAFTPHPKVRALIEKRTEAVKTGRGIDWGTAENLAYASLAAEGVSVRVSGQDSRRGTFNHRHAAIIDSETERVHLPVKGVASGGTTFQIFDSPLSEFGILGFEYGYSVESPDGLTIWEAQFGDFANGAQVIIDQFIVAGETKWDRVSGLVMFLPHGYEGQGAEHSSARIERFLQLCAGNNIQVVYPTTPAQLFHLLRRQVRQPFRKPLVVFTPKSLLRHPLCVSAGSDFSDGRFREVIPDAGVRSPDTVLICTGKVYYDLLERRQRDNRTDVAIIRIEQLYPLRGDLLGQVFVPLKDARQVRWVQEEPANMGAWTFIRPHLVRHLGREPEYVGRAEDAAPAVGSHHVHGEQQERVVDEAFA